MGFSCGIIGLPNVGKSTLFNALTHSNRAEAANYPFATIEPNIGRVAVPDKRLQELSHISNSKKTIPTFLDFVDIAGLVKGASKGEGLGNKFLSHIGNVDAIAHVVRCFEDENISHTSNKINPINDIDIINTELLLADLEKLQNKKDFLVKASKNGNKELLGLLDFTTKLINIIEKGDHINKENFNDKESFFLKELNLISLKPLLYICNVNESSLPQGNNLSEKVKIKAKNEFNECIIISAVIEDQIANFEKKDDRIIFLNEIGLKEPALNRAINSGYNLLNLITFFTSGEKETRAWTVKNGSSASNAAGKIHTDFAKGFIRAETISYNDFIKFNGEAGCKETGKVRSEGKNYKVRDGDVFHFLFNV